MALIDKSQVEEKQMAFEQADEMSLKPAIILLTKSFKFIVSKIIIIVILGLIGGVLGFVYALYKRPVYSAVTTFVLEDANGGAGGLGLSQYAGVAAMAGFDLSGGGNGIFQGDNILELYKSRSMIQKALLTPIINKGQKKILIDRYIDINNLREKWKKPELKKIKFGISQGDDFSRLQDSIIGKIVLDINKKYLSVSKPDKKLGVINVNVNATDESFAKEFNDQIVKTVNDFYVQTKTKKSLQNLAILQHQTDSVKNGLNRAIYQTVEVADATPNLNPTKQVLRVPAQRFQFNAEANKTILTELVKNLELAKISLRQETPLIQVIDTPIYPLPREELEPLKGGLIGFLVIATLTIVVLLASQLFKRII